MEPREFFINLVGTVPLFVRENAVRCLEVLEASAEYRPTHWGTNERADRPYDRDAAIARIPETGKAVQLELLVARTTAPRYEGRLELHAFPTFRLGLREALPPERRPAFFELGEQLAAALTPDYGTVSAFWPVTFQSTSPEDQTLYEHSRSALVAGRKYFRFGPWGMGLRTYLGERFVELAGREALRRTPAHVTEWGPGLCIDLHRPPWEIGADELVQRYRRVMEHLTATGVFATRVGGIVEFRPGPRWQKLPPVKEAPTAVAAPAPRPRSKAEGILGRLQAAIGRKEVVRGLALSGLDLSGAELDELKADDCVAKRARLAGARLVRASLQGVDLEEADLEGASLADAALFDCDLFRARLRRARLAGADLSSSMLIEADLTETDLGGARLDGTLFKRASLVGANLEGAFGLGSAFTGADLTRGRFARARLEQAEFRDAVLRGTDFSGATLVGCDFRGADLEGARWDGARIESCAFDPEAEPTP